MKETAQNDDGRH